MSISEQVSTLFIMAIPIACIAWTVTHEEIFREPREYCERCSKQRKTLLARKFFYVFTCEYCFSHYVTMLFLIITGYKLLFSDWRGYLIGGFSLVWIANFYMSIYNLLRTDLKQEKIDTQVKETELKESKSGNAA
ncbi:hypothetical protein BH10BAC3_BH10BAC3_15890 [soil metagenome]